MTESGKLAFKEIWEVCSCLKQLAEQAAKSGNQAAYDRYCDRAMAIMWAWDILEGVPPGIDIAQEIPS